MCWFGNQLTLTQLHIGHKAAPATAQTFTYRRRDDQQAHWLVAGESIAMLDAARQKDEATLLYMKTFHDGTASGSVAGTSV